MVVMGSRGKVQVMKERGNGKNTVEMYGLMIISLRLLYLEWCQWGSWSWQFFVPPS
jgi:hypothetical protein